MNAEGYLSIGQLSYDNTESKGRTASLHCHCEYDLRLVVAFIIILYCSIIIIIN